MVPRQRTASRRAGASRCFEIGGEHARADGHRHGRGECRRASASRLVRAGHGSRRPKRCGHRSRGGRRFERLSRARGRGCSGGIAGRRTAAARRAGSPNPGPIRDVRRRAGLHPRTVPALGRGAGVRRRASLAAGEWSVGGRDIAFGPDRDRRGRHDARRPGRQAVRPAGARRGSRRPRPSTSTATRESGSGSRCPRREAGGPCGPAGRCAACGREAIPPPFRSAVMPGWLAPRATSCCGRVSGTCASRRT